MNPGGSTLTVRIQLNIGYLKKNFDEVTEIEMEAEIKIEKWNWELKVEI